ncbi:hypothetical protein ALC60_04868, partial [Trachymyrmex zeteki]
SYIQCSHVPNRSTTPDRTSKYICMKGDNTTRAAASCIQITGRRTSRLAEVH